MPSSRKRNRRSRKRFNDADCDIDRKKCETSSKYNKESIANLAEKCGVDIYNDKGKVKTRKELCKNIEENQDIVDDFVYYSSESDNEDVLPISLIENPPLVLVEGERTDVVKTYNLENLKGKKKAELLEIADNLGIEKWKNKSIKYQNMSDIKEAIISFSPTTLDVKEPIIILDQNKEIPVIVVEDDSLDIQYDADELMTKTKKDLLSLAESYGIKKWLNRSIKSHNKSEIVDAIVDYFEGKKPSIPAIISEEIKIVSPSKIINKEPEDILNLIYQKRQDLLKAIECNPFENKMCNEENVCDISEKPYKCISKEEAEYKEKNEDSEILNYNGKKIVGTKQSLDLFKSLVYYGEGVEESKESKPIELETIPVKYLKKPITKATLCNICTYVNDQGVTECIICNSDFTDEEVNKILSEGTEVVEKDNIIPEGTEIVELKNIEDILNEIQDTDYVNLKKFEGMDEAKKKVLYCLGLID